MADDKTAKPTDVAAEPDNAKQVAIKAASTLYDGIRTETLPNGLRVYLLPSRGRRPSPRWSRTGSGRRTRTRTRPGLSHYLEHLLFKGTDKLVARRHRPATQRNGGRNNAYTTEDMTVYHFDFAADRWQTALEIEADRMRNTRIDAKHEFEQEKGAVVAELKGNEDRPWDLEYKAILPLLFPQEVAVLAPGHRRGAARPRRRPPRSSSGTTTSGTTRTTRRWWSSAGSTRTRRWKIKELFGPIPKAELPARKKIPAPRTGATKLEFDSKFELPGC